MGHARIIVSVAALLALASAHCSSDSTQPGSTDGGGADSAVADGGTDAEAGMGMQPVNGCSQADFVTMSDPSSMRIITFPTTSSPIQYAPPCMKIKVGQSVTWNGAFTHHPLEPAGGDAMTPIPALNTGTTTTVAFPRAGTFGFECAAHPNVMFGAILVVP
jgi:plastocyanin